MTIITSNHRFIAAPNLNLTPEEKRAYGQLFRQADTDNVGVVTGEIAVKFFEKTKLDSRILGEIWQIADKENRGFPPPPASESFYASSAMPRQDVNPPPSWLTSKVPYRASRGSP